MMDAFIQRKKYAPNKKMNEAVTPRYVHAIHRVYCASDEKQRQY